MFVGFTHKFFCCNQYMMAESYEDKFKTDLYKKYEVCRKVLIPKDAYFTMLEDHNTAAADIGTNVDTICYQSKCISIQSMSI